MPFAVYVLQNGSGRLYIGHTEDIPRRLSQHNARKGGWTAAHGPWVLVHRESFATRAEAMRREKALKSGRSNQELRRRVNERGC